MIFGKWLARVSAALLISVSPFAAQAADKVVIGDIDDMSGPGKRGRRRGGGDRV